MGFVGDGSNSQFLQMHIGCGISRIIHSFSAESFNFIRLVSGCFTSVNSQRKQYAEQYSIQLSRSYSESSFNFLIIIVSKSSARRKLRITCTWSCSLRLLVLISPCRLKRLKYTSFFLSNSTDFTSSVNHLSAWQKTKRFFFTKQQNHTGVSSTSSTLSFITLW